MNTAMNSWRGWVLAGVSAVLAGCWGGHDGDDQSSATNLAPTSTVTINGTAATGAAIAGGQVVVVNAQGVTATTTTQADGRYSLSIADSAPYMVKVSQGDQVLYSYTPTAGVANITPLTNLAFYMAAEGDDLNELFTRFKEVTAGFSTAEINADIQKAAAQINANLHQLYADQDLDATRYNFFNTPFNANQTGFDAVLDQLNVSINYQAQTVADGVRVQLNGNANAFPFNFDIALTGYSISFTEAPGTGSGNGNGSGTGTVSGSWRLTGTITMSGVTTQIPEQTVPAASVPADIQDATQVIENMAVSGSAGGVGVNLDVSNVVVQTDIDGVVGDSISVTADVKGSVSNIPVNYSYSIRWQRVE